MISLIIINYNTSELLKNCLSSFIRYHNLKDFEIIVVDNNSYENSVDEICKIYPEIKLIKLSENVGFSRANNIAASEANGDILLFLNNDTLFIENSIEKMAKYYVENDNAGIIGPKLLYEDYSFQLSAGRLPNIIQEIIDKIIYTLFKRLKIFRLMMEKLLFNKIKQVGWVTGACMMISKELFNMVNGFDENIFLYFEDKDLCARIKNKNKSIIYFPETSVIHLLGGSSAKINTLKIRKIYRESQKLYYKKHLNKFQNILLNIYHKIINAQE